MTIDVQPLRALPDGLAWDSDHPGVIVPVVMPDPAMGDRCGCCGRFYEDGADEPSNAATHGDALGVLRLLVEAAGEQGGDRVLRIGRQMFLLAWALGWLPGVSTLGALAESLGCQSSAISEAIKWLPSGVREACPRLARKPSCPEKQNHDETLANIG